MGLIKANVAAAAGAQPFSMRDIESQARAIILRARQQAEQLLAAAMAEAEELKKNAHAEGLKEGRAEGLAKGTEEGRKTGHQQALNEHKVELTRIVQGLTGAMSEFDASRRELEAEAIGEVVSLAIAIARRVTKRQGEIDPRVLEENLSEAMKLVVQSSDIRIAINPKQKQVLDAALPALRLQWPSLKHIDVVENPDIAPGGCQLITKDGTIDADLDVQLDRVVADLMPSLEAGASS